MTKNQIEMIKARETERANREREALDKRSQNIDAVTSLAGTAFRGLGSTLLGNIMRKPDNKTYNTYNSQTNRTFNNRYYNKGGRNK